MITDRVLLVSSTGKGAELLQEMLGDMTNELVSAQSGAQARRELLEGEYALVVINTPLSDECGHELSTDAAVNTAAGVRDVIKAELWTGSRERVKPRAFSASPSPMMRARLLYAPCAQELCLAYAVNALLLQKRALSEGGASSA
jgi:response regulator NasT